jgi:hypothetical protein
MKKYDFHTHLFTTWERGTLSLERGSREPEIILNSVIRSGLDGISLVNFEDYRYEHFVDEAKQKRGKYKIVRDIKNALVFDIQGREVVVMKGQEIPTAKGNDEHVLCLGLRYGQQLQSHAGLKKTLEKAREIQGVVVADHVANSLGIGHDNLYVFAKYFDAFESFNANFPMMRKEEKEYWESELKIPGISVSDSHNRRDLGNGHTDTDMLDFSNAHNFRCSFKDMCKRRDFTPVVERQNPGISKLEHIGFVLYDVFLRRKLGFLKSPQHQNE